MIKEKGYKTSDFKNISSEFINLYAPGSSNADLRNYSRKITEIAWSYSSAIVHSPHKTFPDVKIALLFTCMAVSLIENLFLKYVGFDNELACEKCGSKKVNIIETGQNRFIAVCESCKFEEELEYFEEN